MNMEISGPEISKSALIIVDMQNDFVHPEGSIGRRSRMQPEKKVDMAFLCSPVGNIKKLSEAFRNAGRPVIYIMHVVKADYSDAAFPYWRNPRPKGTENIIECTWGSQIIDELKPLPGEHVVIKKGFGGFSNTPLDTILRNLGVTTCVVTGVTTCVCVSTTVRGGVDHNYRMIIAGDATAEVQRDLHDAELRILARTFADLKTTDEIISMLK
jgi:ureidoacrylate peracid hydrolase